MMTAPLGGDNPEGVKDCWLRKTGHVGDQSQVPAALRCCLQCVSDHESPSRRCSGATPLGTQERIKSRAPTVGFT